MQRPFGIALALLTVASSTGGTTAQEQQTAAIDYTLRPSQDITDDESSDDDIWNWENEPGPSALETAIGPPLLGPTGEEPIGPALAGPMPEPPLPPPPGRQQPTIEAAEAADSFAQRGVNLGSFILRPSIEIGVSATDNARDSTDKESAVGVAFAPELDVRADTERYQFEVNARGEAVLYENDEFNSRTVDARARLRYALTGRTALDAEAGYSQFLEGFADPETPAAAAERPVVDTLHAAIGAEQDMGVISGRITAFADREMHEDVDLVGGGTESRAELDNTEFGARFRVAYKTSAVLQPFGEIAAGRRLFDQEHDDSGFARSSFWGEGRLGLVLDRSEKLKGEVSLGYRHEDLEDDRLDDLNVFLANAALVWSPQRLTDVKLDLTTETLPTSTPGDSASILYAGTLSFARNLTARLRAEAGIGASYEDRIGDDFTDLTLSGFADLAYSFSQTLSLIARYDYERTDQSDPDQEFDAHTVGVRVRLQR